MILKYLVQGYPMPTLYFGVANVVANGMVMLRFAFALLFLGLVWQMLTVTVPLCYGSLRTSRTTTRTTLRCRIMPTYDLQLLVFFDLDQLLIGS